MYSESFTKQLWGMHSRPEVRETDLGGDETCVCPKVRDKREGEATWGPKSLPEA